MCGLFGIAGPLSRETQKAEAALATLSHRGPDGRRFWSDDKVALGHARLSIIDLSEAGFQPMVAQDHATAITVNGEIYNFQDLRDELARDFTFTSDSDSEVVLHGYRAWGMEGLLERIEGMYALVVYDIAAGRVFLARDRVGIKPLYYAQIGGNLLWASELKALSSFLSPESLSIDPTAVYDFLTYLYIPGAKTLYKEAAKLEPAHYAAFDIAGGNLSLKRYWNLKTEQDSSIQTPDEAAEAVWSTLRRSVKQQMISDVPLGFFLSGGIDSSAVVAAARAENAETQTYSIGFGIAEHDETDAARLVAEKLDTQHHEHILGESAAANLSERLRDWYDEPFADFSAFPSFLVCQAAKDSVTVALSGDGGDEVFGGYTRYDSFSFAARSPLSAATAPLIAAGRLFGTGSFPSRAARRFERLYRLDGFELYASLLGGLSVAEKRPMRKAMGIADDYDDYWHFRRYDRPELPLRTRLQVIDFQTYLPDDILTKVDRVSMAVSLEVRVPLLATELIELAFSLAEPLRYPGGALKGLLKNAVGSRVPKAILDRPKRGFGLPERQWSQGLFTRGASRQERVLQHFFPELKNLLSAD